MEDNLFRKIIIVTAVLQAIVATVLAIYGTEPPTLTGILLWGLAIFCAMSMVSASLLAVIVHNMEQGKKNKPA